MKVFRLHLIVVGLFIATLLSGAHVSLHNFIADARFALLERASTGDVVVVGIDSKALERIGVWPWPRTLHAKIIDRLHAAGATEIAFDVDFSSSAGHGADLLFAEALRSAGGSVILPAFKQKISNNGTRSSIHHTQPLPLFREHSWTALVNIPVDADGIVRKYPYGASFGSDHLPSLAGMLAGQANRRADTFLVDYSIRPHSIPMISFVDVLDGDDHVLAQAVTGKKILIGAVALELGDRLNVSQGKIIPGVFLQAVATESLLQGRDLRATPFLLALGAALFIAVLVVAVSGRLPYSAQASLLLLTVGLSEVAAFWVQNTWPVIPDTSLLHAAAFGYLLVGGANEIDVRGIVGRIAERRFRRMAVAVGDGLACVDEIGAITFWNPAAKALFGFEPDEIRGQQLHLVLRYSSDQEREFSVQKALREESTKVIELVGRKKNGTTFPIEARLFEWEGRDGAEYGALLRDISARKREMERIRVLAQVDTLTGLANRHTLREHLDALLMEAEANHGEIAVLLLDLDKFKDINDTLGHTGGDQLLADASKRLAGLSQVQQLAARLGGDEFAVLLAAPDARRAAEGVAAEICRRFKERSFLVLGAELQISCSIGIAIFPRDTRSPEEMLSAADLALYQAKRGGGGTVSFFTQEMKTAVAEKLALQSELERALRNREFELFYQPQVSLPDARLIGAEALIRWRHPQRGLLNPGQFMPIVHASPLSNDVAMWVLEAACRQGRRWQRMGHAIQIGVNLSPSQLRLPDFPSAVAAVLQDTRMPPHLLELEVTEDILLHDDEHAGKVFARLRDLGVRLSFDDFGTGYGSLSYLKKFPFDRMKIDRSFVSQLQPNSDDAAIVSSTITLSKLLGMSTIAEGIEDPATIDLLVSMGCSEGQGFLFGKPLPLTQFERKWLSKDEFAATQTEATANAA